MPSNGLPSGFIGTIGDEEDICYNDSSEEDEAATICVKGFKSDDFTSGKSVWNEILSVNAKRKGTSSLEETIAQVRGRWKRLKVDKDDGETALKSETGEETALKSESAEETKDELLENDPEERGDILKDKRKKIKICDSASQVNNELNKIRQDFDDTATFLQMNLSIPLLKAIKLLNFFHPTPIQYATIPVALLGRDIYACAATGTGKTAAFMLPVLERLLYKAKGQKMTRILVLLPTRELAVQVYEVSRQLAQFTKIEIALIVGGFDIKPQELVLRQLPDVVIATPGRLIDHLENTPSFSLHNIQILILDEADRILDEYFAEQMKEIMKQCSFSRQTMLFSATLNEDVEDLAATALKNPVKILLNNNTDVALNLQQEFVRIRSQREADREAILAALITRTFKDHVMVFVQTKKQVHRLYVLLGLLGIKCAEIRGDMNQPERLEALRKFKEEIVDVLIATDVAARGLDIVRVKTVINFTMPCTLQHYIHRVGRTARAGRGGRSVSLVGEKERKLMKDIIKEAKNTVKSRQVPTEILTKYSDKLGKLEVDLSRIMKEEAEEKELQSTEKSFKKTEQLCTGTEEKQQSRAWFQTVTEKKKEQQSLKLGDSKKRKKGQRPTTEDRISVELQKAIDFQIRAAKRSQKPQKIRTMTEKNNNGKKAGRSFEKKSGFDEELRNTSKNAVKQYRYKATAHTNLEKRMKVKSKNRAGQGNNEERTKYKTKSCKKFKSKTRYRRKK